MTYPASIRWLSGFKKTAGGYLALSVGLGLSSGIFLILQASVLAWVVHQVVMESQELSDVMAGLWLILVLIVLRSVLVWLSRHCSSLAASRVKESVRNRILENMGQANPLSLASRSSGDLVHLAVDGPESLEGYFSGYLPQIALAALIPAAILAFVFPLDWISGLILLVTAPLIPLCMVRIGRKAEKLNQEQWQKITRLSHRFLDAIQGLTTLKMFNAGKREARVVGKISDEYRQSTLSVLRVAFLSALVLELLATMSVALVAMFIGLRLFWGELDFQAGFFILLLAPEFFLPLRNLGTHFHARMSAASTAEKILNLLSLPRYKTRETNFKPHYSRIEVCLEKVDFEYEPGRTAIRNLSFTALDTGLTCIYGESGAGKSTVLRLILGLLPPNSGQVLINQTPLEEIDLDLWHRHIAYLPQAPHLLSQSVADNIRLGKSSATFAEIRDAARWAGIEQDILNLPQGYSTLLGEDGQDLSGGQRQRLALARAFIRDCPLVLMDEPVSGLDPSSREVVHQSVLDLARTRAVIVSTHDLEILSRADKAISINREGS